MNDLGKIKALILHKLTKKSKFTRPEIYNELGVRSASVIDIVNKMKVSGIFSESGQSGVRSGSKASTVSLNRGFMNLVGIDFRPERIVGVLCDFQGRVLCSSSISLSKKIDVEIAHRMIVETVNSLCSKSKISVNDIGGIGLADPGFVDIKRGISLNASNIDGWINLQTKKWLAKEFGCKYNTVYPGAMTMAFYEYSKLCNQNKKSLFLLEFGVGIGGAFMKGGEIFKGDQNTGMEIGHIVIDPNGPICNCGNRGCLEAIAGSTGVRRRVNELLKSGVFIPIKSDETLISDFVKSVANGNKAASTLAYEISEKIGDSLASVVAILNPSTIIMSGELAGMGDILLSTVKKCIALKCFPAAVEKLDVRIAPEEEYSGSKGVVNILRNKILRDIFV